MQSQRKGQLTTDSAVLILQNSTDTLTHQKVKSETNWLAVLELTPFHDMRLSEWKYGVYNFIIIIIIF